MLLVGFLGGRDVGKRGEVGREWEREGDKRSTVSEEETRCGFAFLVEEVDDLEHEFDHKL